MGKKRAPKPYNPETFELDMFIKKNRNGVLQDTFKIVEPYDAGVIIGAHRKHGAFLHDEECYNAYKLTGDDGEEMIRSMGLDPNLWRRKAWTGWGINGWIAYIVPKEEHKVGQLESTDPGTT